MYSTAPKSPGLTRLQALAADSKDPAIAAAARALSFVHNTGLSRPPAARALAIMSEGGVLAYVKEAVEAEIDEQSARQWVADRDPEIPGFLLGNL